MDSQEPSEPSSQNRKFLLAITLISLTGLALEIVLTRLVSVLFFPPAVFGILSLAILGIGSGAALVTWRERCRSLARTSHYLGAAAASVVVIAVAAAAPALQLALIGLVILPFVFIGMVLTTLFSLQAKRSPQLYLADLVGAGLGALLAVPLLNWLGGLDGLLFVAILLAASAWLLSDRPQAYIPLTITMLVFASNLLFSWLTVDMSRLPTEKPILDTLGGTTGKVIETRWDAFARTDLVDPGGGGPYRLYMDGAAGSIMPPAANNDFLWGDIGLFPFATEQPKRVFLIGPGGGLDVWFALQSGAETIKAVEVNPASVALVSAYAEYNDDLYGHPQVEILVDEGRSVLQRDQGQYELIFLSQLVTLTAERNGYSLVENNSYTVEAFREYLAHLTPVGQIGIKLYDEPTLTRALSTALAALQQAGLASSDQEGLKHIIALLDGGAQPPIPLLIVRKSPFTHDDALILGTVARRVGFTPLFVPGVLAQPPLDAVAAGSRTFGEVIANSENDLSPTTDNRPFFYQFERGVPRSLRPLLWAVVVGTLLGGGLVVLHQQRAGGGRQQFVAPIYFAGLGLGFILLEIGVIHRTGLFLGHPTTAITVVLAALLISGGLGSQLGGLWFKEQNKFPRLPLLAVIFIAAFWLLLWPWLQAWAMGARLWLRIMLVLISLFPLGLFMGMPFPLGLRAVANWGRQQVALAWAVNGVMSVFGSILAVTVSILSGYQAVLWAGGLAYGLAVLAIFFEEY